MRKQPAPSDLADKFVIRLPEGLRERLAIVARENGRSMNSEMVARLLQSLDATAGDDKLDLLLRQSDAALTLLARLAARGGRKE